MKRRTFMGMLSGLGAALGFVKPVLAKEPESVLLVTMHVPDTRHIRCIPGWSIYFKICGVAEIPLVSKAELNIDPEKIITGRILVWTNIKTGELLNNPCHPDKMQSWFPREAEERWYPIEVAFVEVGGPGLGG